MLGNTCPKELASFYNQYEVRHIFITPWPTCIPLIKESKCLVIIGTDDGGFLNHHIEEIKGIKSVDLFIIPHANHDLDVSNTMESIDFLRKSCVRIQTFMHHCFR